MKKSRGYKTGGLTDKEKDDIGASPSGSGATRGPRNRAAEIRAGVPSDSLPEDGREVGKIPKEEKPPVKKNMGGMMKYGKDGKVRGCGLARRKRG